MFYANGISPLRNGINKILTRKIVNRIDVITLREELSRNELERLCIDEPRISITSDPALTLDAAEDKEVDSIFCEEGIDIQGPYIGFSIRKWPGYEKYIRVIARAADYAISELGLKPVFIPMQYPEDLYVANAIVSRMNGKGYIIRTKNSASQTIGIIKRMELLVGMRLHSLIFAASTGTPLVGLVYESKVEGFLQYINQSSASAGHVEQLEFKTLKHVMDNVWNQRKAIRIQLEKGTASLREKALESARIAIELIENGA
jgi:polysaccharide pyruvyl transferase WcaK-like protein